MKENIKSGFFWGIVVIIITIVFSILSQGLEGTISEIIDNDGFTKVVGTIIMISYLKYFGSEKED